MNTRNSFFLGLRLCAALFVPALTTHAADDLKVTGWIPYWAVKEGTKDALKHLNQLDAVYPFVYTVKQDGTLKDNGDVEGRDWQKLFRAARAKDVEVIPTIMSGDGALMHDILSDGDKRKAHIKDIVRAVEKGKFDGIDIDYEGRTKATIEHFSIFLKELKDELGTKKLVCTLEPRTPPESLWKNPPSPLPYSNDYTEIEKHCDVIQIMTYDQQRADIKLNEAKAGQPYFPNSDPDWVEKVVEHTVKELPNEKLMLGIPTYGRHMAVTVAPNWFQNYQGLGAVNPPQALAIAKKQRVKPSVNRAGEQSFTYFPKEMPRKLRKTIEKMKVDDEVSSGMKAAMQALAYANKTGDTVTVNMVWWSDAEAIKDKIELAQKYNLRGVAVFKIDGQEDAKMWSVLK